MSGRPRLAQWAKAVAVGEYGGYFAYPCKPQLKKILTVCRLLLGILCSIVHTLRGKRALNMTKILLADHYSLFRAGMMELIHSIGGSRSREKLIRRNPLLNLPRNTHQTFCC